MMARNVVMVTALVVLTSGISAGDGKKDDKDKLQGEWAVISIDVSGKKWDADQIKEAKPLKIKGDKWTASSGEEFTFKIDPTKSPKQCELQREKDSKVNTWQGIYKIEGDTLTLCRSTLPVGFPGATERPTEFKAGKGVALLQFKRSGK